MASNELENVRRIWKKEERSFTEQLSLKDRSGERDYGIPTITQEMLAAIQAALFSEVCFRDFEASADESQLNEFYSSWSRIAAHKPSEWPRDRCKFLSEQAARVAIGYHHAFRYHLANARNAVASMPLDSFKGGSAIDELREALSVLVMRPQVREFHMRVDETLDKRVDRYKRVTGPEEEPWLREERDTNSSNVLEVIADELSSLASLLFHNKKAFGALKEHAIQRLQWFEDVRCLPTRGTERGSLTIWKTAAGASALCAFVVDQAACFFHAELRDPRGDYLANAIGGVGGVLLLVADYGC